MIIMLHHLALLLLIVIEVACGARPFICPSTHQRFEKVIGVKPSPKFSATPLYKGSSPDEPITNECVARCVVNDECYSFVLNYKNNSCHALSDRVETQRDADVLDADVSWFIKICLKDEINCQSIWLFERIPGATLIGNNTKKLPQLVTRLNCQQYCLNESDFTCRSIKYKIQSPNAIASSPHFYAKAASAETVGTCTLSNTDRYLTPNAFRVSDYDDEYFENQCTNSIVNEFCAFEEYDNVILSHIDLRFKNLTQEQCQDQCVNNSYFKCRGYSIIAKSKVVKQNQQYLCLLHSENTKVRGPKILQNYPNAKYYERAPCLNISVTCTQTDMTITFQPDYPFSGRLYMKGYSDDKDCYANGNKTSLVELNVPLKVHKCGILEVRSTLNRTLFATTMILQYNTLVQTQADRIIKVGCIFTNSSKVVVGAGINFTDNDSNAQGTSIVNSSSTLPSVTMRIVDANTHTEVSNTEIGDDLQLIIQMDPSTMGMDMWAGHLVAMSENGQDSILLLDDRGCPTNLDVFPGLTKSVNGTSLVLQSTFQAFKFSSSSVIRFSVIVQFCPKKCPEPQCGAGTFYSRKKRKVDDEGDVESLNRTEFEKLGHHFKMVPLEFVLIVRNTDTAPDRLVYGDSNRILVAGYDYLNNEICIDYSLLLGIVIVWILIQIILLVSCIVLIRRYKKYYENQCISESLEELHKNFGLGFSNLDRNRRVHFADGHLT